MRKTLIVFVSLLIVGSLYLMIVSMLAPQEASVTGAHLPIPAFSNNLGSSRQATENVMLDYAEQLHVVNTLGRVSLVGADIDYVEAKIVKNSRSTNMSTADQLLEQIEVETKLTPQGTEIITHIPSTTGNDQASVDLFLTVPSEIIADLTLNLGELEIKDLSGELMIRNNLGSIDITNFTGNAHIEANLGAVNINDAVFDEQLQIIADLGKVFLAGTLAKSTVIENSLGDVTLRIPTDESYALDAKIGIGNSSFSIPFTGDRSRNTVRGIIGTGEQVGNLSVIVSLGSLYINHK